MITIDPGQTSGLARWAGSVLIYAAKLRPVEVFAVLSIERGLRVIIELPQIYTRGKSKADPNDLVKLAVLVGEYKREAERHGHEVHLRKPAAWKGQLKKDVVKNRVEHALSPAERAVVRNWDNYDCVESIGIGLDDLGRF